MHPYSKEMRKFCLADKTVNSFVIAVYMPMMCWRNGVFLYWENDDLFSESELYEEIQRGSFVEATEHERLLELRTFISRLHIKTTLLGNTVSNTVPFVGMIPNDRVRVLNELDSAIKNAGEKELRRYRDSIRSL